MSTLPVFLINLDGSETRLNAATLAMQAEGVSFVRHSAFDARGKDPQEIPEYDTKETRTYMGRDLSGGEVGCFISHVEVAKRFLETDAAFALVLEDDMKPLSGGLAKAQALISSSLKDQPVWDVAHLAAERLKITTPLCDLGALTHKTTMFRAHYFPMRSTALLWSRKGAERFVQSAYPITCPLDIHLRRLMQQNDGGVALSPPCFSTTDAASEIDMGKRIKRGGQSRSPLYQLKRATRVFSENLRAATLQRRAQRLLK